MRSGRGPVTVFRSIPSLVVLLPLAVLPPLSASASQSLDPYWKTSRVFAKARTEARAGRINKAVGLLNGLKNRIGITDSPPSEALDFHIGRLLEKAGRLKEAARRFTGLRDGVLSDSALFREGNIRLRLGETGRARTAFAMVSRASSKWLKARTRLADALAEEGRPSLAVSALREVFRAGISRSGLHDARVALAMAMEARGDRETAFEYALSAYMNASSKRHLQSAGALLARLGKRPPRLIRKLRKTVNADGRTLRQLARWAHRYSKTIRKLYPGLAPFIRGSAYLRLHNQPLKSTKYLRAAEKAADDSLVKAYSGFTLARALAIAGNDEGARDAYLRIVKEYPRSPVAAEATIGAARCMMRLGDFKGALTTLQGIETEYPYSGLINMAEWQMALACLTAGWHGTALRFLEKADADNERGDGLAFGPAERALYFRGMLLDEMGRIEEATSLLERVARSFPHSYYSVLAVSRLGHGAKDKAAFVESVTGPGIGSPIEDPPGFTRQSAGKAARFDATAQTWRSGTATSGPIMLWRLDYRKEALGELKAKARRGQLDKDGLVVLAAMTAHGRSPRGAMYSRRHLRGRPEHWNESVFSAAYPCPFSTHVSKASADSGLDPAFIYGVMRTESSFGPRARSGAGAIGIMQLMPRTARVIAGRLLGNARLARKLRSPDANIQIGTAFLAELGNHFRGHLPLMLAAYNAGPEAARKFHRRLKHLPTDVFVEAVPYRATSAFIKRVIGYAAGYRGMYSNDGRGPFLLSMKLPDNLGPFMETADNRR